MTVMVVAAPAEVVVDSSPGEHPTATKIVAA